MEENNQCWTDESEREGERGRHQDQRKRERSCSSAVLHRIPLPPNFYEVEQRQYFRLGRNRAERVCWMKRSKMGRREDQRKGKRLCSHAVLHDIQHPCNVLMIPGGVAASRWVWGEREAPQPLTRPWARQRTYVKHRWICMTALDAVSRWRARKCSSNRRGKNMLVADPESFAWLEVARLFVGWLSVWVIH